jgi:hypothetical protein
MIYEQNFHGIFISPQYWLPSVSVNETSPTGRATERALGRIAGVRIAENGDTVVYKMCLGHPVICKLSKQQKNALITAACVADRSVV